jgi:hypothetical protein
MVEVLLLDGELAFSTYLPKHSMAVLGPRDQKLLLLVGHDHCYGVRVDVVSILDDCSLGVLNNQSTIPVATLNK